MKYQMMGRTCGKNTAWNEACVRATPQVPVMGEMQSMDIWHGCHL